MEKDLMVINISEAEVQLREVIQKLKKDDYGIVEFQIDMEHIMSHINMAYNIRNWSKERIDRDYQKSFDLLKKVPEDKYSIE